MVIDLNLAARQDEPLTAISVAGFKSIAREQTLHFAPLTILAGANSSGKSSMMQPLLLMKQTIEAPYDPGVFLLDGPNVRFTNSNQILSNDSALGDGVFCTSFSTDSGSVFLCYKENNAYSFDVYRVTIKTLSGELTFGPEYIDRESIANFLRKELQMGEDAFQSNEIGVYVFVDRCMSYIDLSPFSKKSPGSVFLPLRWFDLEDVVTDIIHLPGLRGNPERAYKTSGVGTKFSGTFENYVASIINYWQQQHPDNLHSLCRHLEHIGLTSKVSATALDATQVEIKVGRLPGATDADLVNIADVGVGVSQTLPVLVALLAAEPGQIVYIEQPEIHLHPLAQYKLAAVIAEASKRGVLVVIETHSDILIRGVQTLVAKGELDPNIVKLHWFSRSPEDGSTTVTCAELDENGSFGDWPQDFDTTTLLTEKAYLDAVEERLFRNAK
ncbi:AAA family ATPase [Solidesulfovibrio carbinolicus]|uniref:ATPase AAA-type core domain-containing protein n=1 Tax=Solidesulfovibrio carbinolicus TaxID=296842 RepID=A0A4P6HIR0_9BACT|nr:AAA family ATPase [Solidesulfovibrio carbinolicus]QAZ66294.1 hypothetical protein C3Y92_03170 [Solidesulfovibrio carbinolicus]